MAKTANDVITHAMERINRPAPDGDEYALALAEYEQLHVWGRDHYPRSWSWNSDAVDERYWVHVAGLLAGRLTSSFSINPETMARAERSAARAEVYLRQQFSRPVSHPAQNDYF